MQNKDKLKTLLRNSLGEKRKSDIVELEKKGLAIENILTQEVNALMGIYGKSRSDKKVSVIDNKNDIEALIAKKMGTEEQKDRFLNTLVRKARAAEAKKSPQVVNSEKPKSFLENLMDRFLVYVGLKAKPIATRTLAPSRKLVEEESTYAQLDPVTQKTKSVVTSQSDYATLKQRSETEAQNHDGGDLETVREANSENDSENGYIDVDGAPPDEYIELDDGTPPDEYVELDDGASEKGKPETSSTDDSNYDLALRYEGPDLYPDSYKDTTAPLPPATTYVTQARAAEDDIYAEVFNDGIDLPEKVSTRTNPFFGEGSVFQGYTSDFAGDLDNDYGMGSVQFQPIYVKQSKANPTSKAEVREKPIKASNFVTKAMTAMANKVKRKPKGKENEAPAPGVIKPQ